MKVKRIAAGHYVGPRGEVRNIKSESGAHHTRCRACWLITKTDGSTALVDSLAVAKLIIGPVAPLRERLCTPMTVGQASVAMSTVI